MILRTLMLALVAVLFAGFTSCSKSSDDEPKSNLLYSQGHSVFISCINLWYFSLVKSEATPPFY